MPVRRQTFLNVVLHSPRVAAAWSRGRWVMLSRTARGTCMTLGDPPMGVDRFSGRSWLFARELAGTGEDSASSYAPSSAGSSSAHSWSAEVSAWWTTQGFSTVWEKFSGEEGVVGCIIIISDGSGSVRTQPLPLAPDLEVCHCVVTVSRSCFCAVGASVREPLG